MGGFSQITGDPLGSVMNANNVSFDGTERGGVVTTDGQLLIGSTALPHIRVSTITPGAGVSISNGSGSITVGLSGTGAIQTLTADTGGALSPTAGNFNLLGSGSLTTAGSGSTITSQLTGLTNHSVLVGAGTATITKIGPSATSGQVLQSTGSSADPAFSTATYPSTTTINQVLYSSANNAVGGITAANNGTLISSAIGAPSWLSNGTTGQILTATTGSPPSWAPAPSTSITLTGDTGTASGSNINLVTASNCGQSVTFVGNNSTTMNFKVTDSGGNTFIGQGTGASNGFSTEATALGFNALTAFSAGSGFNTALGSRSLTGLTTGSYNIGVGAEAGSAYTGSEQANISIGAVGVVAENRTTRIGFIPIASTLACFIDGINGVSVSGNPTICSSSGQIGTLAPANNSVLSMNGSGVASMSQTPRVSSITFDGTNVLSSYVASTFVPVLAFGGASVGITYGTQVGTYQRVGGIVYINITIILTNKGSSTGNASITGLPITSRTGPDCNIFMQCFTITVAGATSFYANIASNTTSLLLAYNVATTGAASALANTNFGNTTQVSINGFYFV